MENEEEVFDEMKLSSDKDILKCLEPGGSLIDE